MAKTEMIEIRIPVAPVVAEVIRLVADQAGLSLADWTGRELAKEKAHVAYLESQLIVAAAAQAELPDPRFGPAKMKRLDTREEQVARDLDRENRTHQRKQQPRRRRR